MGDVEVDKVSFGYGFMEQVLNRSVQVAILVGSYDFLGELGEQVGWKVMESQVEEEVVFCC